MAPAKKKPAAKKVPAREAAPKAGTSKEAAEARKRRFVEAYLSNGENAAEAAVTAGYSAHTARQQGARLLTDVAIATAVRARREKLVRKYELNTEMVVRSIVQELTFDPARMYDHHGRLKPITQMDEDTRAALLGVEITEEVIGGGKSKKDQPLALLRTAKVKWASKQGAREQAMKHLGMFEKDNAQRSLMDGVPREILLAIAERLKHMKHGQRQ